MLSRLTGALLRAVLIGGAFALPLLIVPADSPGKALVVSILVVSAFFWTFVEYASASPSIIEFRDTPPFNRIRFLTMAAIIFALSHIQAHGETSTPLTTLAFNVGVIVGHSVDFTGSPIWMMTQQFPGTLEPGEYATYLASAGMAYLLALASVIVFMAVFFLQDWPAKSGPFNMWKNLPSFNPSSDTDIVSSLNFDARVNILLGFVLPFLIPWIIGAVFRFIGISLFGDPYLMIWVVSGWAILPAGMIMRGVALSKVSQMIAAQRKVLEAQATAQGLSTAP